MKTYVKSGILAGLVLFFWGAFSWMVLPWHAATLHSFVDSKAVERGLVANVAQSGIYVAPLEVEAGQGKVQQALIFASVHLEGMPSSMVPAMLISLLTQMFAALLVAYMLSKTSKLNYYKRVQFVLFFALAASAIAYIPYCNWFAFDGFIH